MPKQGLNISLLFLCIISTAFYLGFSQPTFSDNCLNWNVALSVCQQCNPGFYLEFFFCVPCNPNCACSSKNDFCQSCLVLPFNGLNYYSYLDQSQNQCFLCNTTMPYCLQCNNANFCTQCWNGQYLVQEMDLDGVVIGQYCSPNQCSPTCQFCENSIKCSQCQPGYYLFQNGSCSSNPCATNCSTCATLTTCQTCVLGYYLNQTISPPSCQPCAVANCSQCTESTNCQACVPSMVLSNNSCNSTGLSNCIQYANNQTVCTGCEQGYEVTAGNCNQCTGCDVCNEQFICLTPCLPGYQQFNFACIPSYQKKIVTYSFMLMIICALFIF